MATTVLARSRSVGLRWTGHAGLKPVARPLPARVLLVRLYETPSNPPPPPIKPSSSETPSSSQIPKNEEAPRNEQPPPPPGKDAPLVRRLAHAWNSTPTRWYPLPLAVGAALLVGLAWKKKYYDARQSAGEGEVEMDEDGEVVRLRGPWQVHVLAALPLRSLSRLWGTFNSLTLPTWFRPYGYRFYAWVFGANLDEVELDLREYKSLGEFFYRRLKPGVRPVAAEELVSPADGTLVHLGSITPSRRVEQVKGITYSLDSLLGRGHPSSPVETPNLPERTRERDVVVDEEFADVNGIRYSLGDLMGSPGSNARPDPSPTPDGQSQQAASPVQIEHRGDQSIPRTPSQKVSQTVQVAQDMGLQAAVSSLGETLQPGNRLWYFVVYLAPGDYHRFHSPASWVVEKRRHFSGELFSVNPWLVSRLPNLFVLNERVALLGKWRHGFFSFVPVGATNVGSIKISFDSDLRTNSVGKRPPPGTFVEASYASASRVLGGMPLLKGEEMGGFALGSTIVVVFEAPEGWEWKVRAGEKVRVGQAVGGVRKDQ